MIFKFIGKDSQFYGFYTGKNYKIIQFGIQNNHFIIYALNEEYKVTIIPYTSIDKFNDNWEYIDE